jgi:hypothetical protein
MKQVHTVWAQVRAPRSGDPGVVVEGAYTVADGVVTLTDREGRPVRDGDGKLYTRKIENGDTAKAVAARMTKQFRTALSGGDQRVSGFSGPIRYPRFGVA